LIAKFSYPLIAQVKPRADN